MRAPRCVALCTQGSTAATSTLRSDRSQTSGRLPKLMLQRVPSRHKQEASQPLGGPALTAPGTATPTAPEDRLGTSAEDSTVQRANRPWTPCPDLPIRRLAHRPRQRRALRAATAEPTSCRDQGGSLRSPRCGPCPRSLRSLRAGPRARVELRRGCEPTPGPLLATPLLAARDALTSALAG